MLISSFRYTRGLDLDARAYAEVTGIAVGWLDGKRQVFRCGCWVCEFVVEVHCGDKDPQATQAGAIVQFEEQTARYGCLHWNKYMRYREEGPTSDFLVARQTLRKAEVKAAKSNGKAPVEEPIWELEVGDDEVDFPEDPAADPSEELAFEAPADVESELEESCPDDS